MHIETLIQIAIGLVFFWGFYMLKQAGKKSKSEIQELIKAGAKIIDVRSAAEFSAGHYEGAVNISLDSLSGKMGKLGKKDAPYVLYCASGARSSAAVIMLRKNGFTNVVNAGGLGSMPRK